MMHHLFFKKNLIYVILEFQKQKRAKGKQRNYLTRQ